MSSQQHRVRVAAVARLSSTIREIHLQADTGTLLPAFSPGSHVVLNLPLPTGTRQNAYSLTSSPFDRSLYRIAVRRQAESRGGSHWLHDQLTPGQYLTIETPCNYFPLRRPAQGAPLLLIAGGIGITPFMAFLQTEQPGAGDLQLHYAFRDRADTAYLEWLKWRLDDDLYCYEAQAGMRLDLAALLADQRAGTQVYVCEPSSLINAVCDAAKALGWPDNRVQYERFSAPSDGPAFRVRLQRSGRSIEVAAGESLLEALEREQVSVRKMCRSGVCGECRTPLLGGQADHQDLFLSDEEKAGQCAIMPCVSRAAAGSELLLDL
jgi:ferredoxin-NADP reductase